MPAALRGTVFAVMFAAFALGFFDVLFGRGMERLHIFLFNLCCGGFVILNSAGRSGTGRLSFVFAALAVTYALLAHFELYAAAAVLAVLLSLLVELARIRIFGLLPLDFFRRRVDAADKFHQAALLCLSIGLMISALVIVNNAFFRWFHFEKLTLVVFFLGYSFPVSLITLSAVFSFLRRRTGPAAKALGESAFWIINLGVIFFFGFIIFELFLLKLLIALLLFFTVLAVFIFFIRNTPPVQQRVFLTSGMFFLLSTAVTGILYILLKETELYVRGGPLLLKAHAFLSLYGWNLCGLIILIRRGDFPLRLTAKGVMILHWACVLVCAPAGRIYTAAAAVAIACFGALLLLFHRD